jgi:hypothetical protein
LFSRKIWISIRTVVSEDESISIKEVADLIVKAIGFEGEYTVGATFLGLFLCLTTSILWFSLIQQNPMDNSASRRPTPNFYDLLADSNSPPSVQVRDDHKGCSRVKKAHGCH